VPLFQDLGTNGRTCFSCHRPAEAWTVTPAELRERFERTAGLDPIFRTNDGSNCEGADVSTLRERRSAFSLLLRKGLIRIGLELPANAEFEIVDVDDPYGCGAPYTSASMYRRPLPSTNLDFLSTVMWDGRETVPGQAIELDLMTQARNAHHRACARCAALRCPAARDRRFRAGSLHRANARLVGRRPSRRRYARRSESAFASAVLHWHQRSARHAAVDARRL
jgi:hypothetical protein